MCELRKSVCTGGITVLIVKRNLPDAMIGVKERKKLMPEWRIKRGYYIFGGF